MSKDSGLSIELRNRLHSKVPNRIWTAEERVYGHSPAGNLDVRMGIRTNPLQQGFCGYGQTRLPVAVDDEAALASEQRIVGGIMSLPHSTAARTPLGRVPAIDDVQRNTFVKTSLLKILPECVKRYSHHLSIEPLSLGTESFQILNYNISIMLQGKVSDVSHNFSDSVLHKVMLSCLGSIQLLLSRAASSIRIGAEKALTFEHFLAPFPEILSEIYLAQDFSIGRQYCDCEAFGVDINPENVLPSGYDDIGLGKKRDDLQVRSQSEGLACPAASEQPAEPVPIPIFPDRDCDPFSGAEAKFDERERFGLEPLAVARDIELHGHTIDSCTAFLFPPSASGEVADHLDVESSAPFGLGTDAVPEVVELCIPDSLREKSVCLQHGHFFKFGKNFLLEFGCYTLKKNRSLHPNARARKLQATTYGYLSSLLPPVNGVGFRSEGFDETGKMIYSGVVDEPFKLLFASKRERSERRAYKAKDNDEAVKLWIGWGVVFDD